jgi:hypothetical protein
MLEILVPSDPFPKNFNFTRDKALKLCREAHTFLNLTSLKYCLFSIFAELLSGNTHITLYPLGLTCSSGIEKSLSHN